MSRIIRQLKEFTLLGWMYFVLVGIAMYIVILVAMNR